MKRILLTGGSGLLSTNWVQCYSKKNKILLGLHKIKVNYPNTEQFFLPYSSYKNMGVVIDTISPDVIVHTAGMTNVDECEINREECLNINSDLAGNMAKLAFSKGICLTHISTDHFYDGKGSFYKESDPTNSVNIYAKSKLEAEKNVLNEYPNSLIIRTNFYGFGNKIKQSFSDWIINSLLENIEINVFQDVYYTPILIDELVKCINILWEIDATGIFNVVSSQRISKYEFALKIAKTFGLDSKYIKKGSIKKSSLLAKRPPDMSLSNQKFIRLTNYIPLNLDQSIKELYYQFEEGRINDINRGFNINT